MLGTFRLPLAAAAVLALATAGRTEAAAPAPPAGTNITLPYPAKAPLVVQVNGLERAKDRLAKMLEALPATEAKQLNKELDAGLTHLLAGRKLTAVPKDGRVFVVVHDFAKVVDEEPAVAVLVPVTGYKEFKESFLTADERKTVEKAGEGVQLVKTSATGDERTVYLVELKGYVALTPSKDTAEVYAGKYTPAQSGAMGPDLSTSFLAADAAIYVNMDVINDLYGDQIRAFKGLIDFALGQAQQGGMLPGLNKKQLELVKVVLNGFVQAIEDAKGVVIAAEFRPEGLNVRAQVRFADDSTSAALLKTEAPTPLAELDKLPRGMNTYGGTKFGKKVADLARKFAQEFLASDDDEKGNDRIEKLLGEVAAAGPQAEYTAASAPEISLNVTPYKNPEKAVTAMTQLYKGLAAGSRFASIVLKDKPKVTEAAQTYRGFTFSEVRLNFDFAATAESLPENVRESTLAQFKRLMKEKTTEWIGTDGKVVVTISAKDWDAAKKVLDDYLDGKAPVGEDPGYQLTRKNLPPEASMVSLLETGQVLVALVDQVKAVGQAIPGGVIPPIGSVKPVKGDATYLGIAVTLKPQTAAFDLFVPGTAMNVAAKMLAPLFRNVE
ncbi:MAG: hypothetical protein JWO38_4122 [Gemmataceae bacterium]|nr:hypothetical protein [Gemmataceae bacterium]